MPNIAVGTVMQAIIHYKPLLRRYDHHKDLLGFPQVADGSGRGSSQNRAQIKPGPIQLIGGFVFGSLSRLCTSFEACGAFLGSP